MRPNQQQPPQPAGAFSSSSTSANRSRPRRRAAATLPLPQRDPAFAVPLPLPQSNNSATSTSNANATAVQLVNFSELDRVNRVGSGTGGTVYKVIHRPSSRAFALKVIYGSHEESVRRQICRAIEILRDVDHPNVVKCHEMYYHNGEIQVLLEFMDGGSLEGTHIPQESNLSDLARQILSGLNYLHRRHIVHRDIKPSNLLINSKKKVKIADFGVSRILDQTMDPCNSSVGTIAYMSPERINTDLNHRRYDGYAGDIWSLGVSILEIYLGRFPFAVGRQGDCASLMCAIRSSRPPEAPPSASDEFRNFISCCLQSDPASRWTAAQLLRHPFIVRRLPGQNQDAGILYHTQPKGLATGMSLPPPSPRESILRMGYDHGLTELEACISEAAELKPTIVATEMSTSSQFHPGSVQSKDSDYDFKDEQKLKVNETFNKRCSVKDVTKRSVLEQIMFKCLSGLKLEKQKLTVSDASKKSAAGESQPTEVEFKKFRSSHSLGESLPSKDFDYNFKGQELKVNEGSGKRTALVHSDTDLGELHPDGYNWRTYGQKVIRKTIFPREYYRCAHRHTQGCFATKQVQREDEDSTSFSVTYKGRHTCTPAPDLMPPGPPEILAPVDTVLGADGNDKKDSQSNLQSSAHSPDNQTCISTTELTNELPNLGLNLNVFPEKSFESYPMWKNFYENEVRKNWKVLNRKKDVLLLPSSYPMIMIDKSDTDKWIIDVLEIMRDVKLTEKILFGVGLAKHWPGMTRLRELSGRLQKLLDVPLMNEIEGVLPVDLVENLYRPTDADLRPLLEAEQNIISGKTSKSGGSPSNSEGAAMEAENELQPMPARCKTLVEDTELSAKENIPEEIFDLGIYLAVRQILECINRGYIWCITISGRDKKRVLGAIKQHQDIVSEFGYIIVFTVSEDQSGANVHGVFHLQKGFWLGGCFDSVDLTREYFDNLCSPGILLLTEDDYDQNMNLDHSTLPLSINLNKLVDHKHSDSRFIIFTSKMEADMEIRMEDHLLSWKLFCRILGEGLLSPRIQQIAASLVKECRGNLLAIILMARSLEKVTDDVNLWELAVKRLTMLRPSQIEDIDNVLINALTFIWERMNNKTRHCIKLFTWYPKGEKIDRVSLIQHWIQDCLVDTYDEGTNIIQNLVDTSLLNIVELNRVQLRREIYDVLVSPLILQMHPLYLMLGSARLIKPPEEEEWDAKVIHLMDNKLSDLPESPRSPSLIALYLQDNLDLVTIPSCFFKHMPLLQILDLSHTSIKSLPESLSSLVNLRELLLKGCELFIRLPSHVGELKNLGKLDLDETQIIDLPAEIGQLSKLKILRVSFYGYMNCSKTRLRQDTIIPPGTISGLSELTELSIDVDPDDERWNATVKAIIEEACNLKTLKQLNLYLPNIEILWKRRTGSTSLLHYPLPRFRFTVGYHKQQVISRVPEEVEAHFNKSDKCLKFVKGKDIPAEMRKVLNHSTAFFLEGHATAKSLSDFGIENTRLLKCCLLTECNEVKTIIDLSQGGGHSQVYTRRKGKSKSLELPEEQTDALGNLQDLNIYYMKNLESICKGPVHKHCLASLKFLALHKCPRLSTIFSLDLVANLANLEELIVEHCPQLTSLVSLIGHASSNSAPQPNCFLPSLKRISLLYMPNLVSISSGLCIAPELEKVGFYNCPKLKSLSAMEMSSDHLKGIKGESNWWEALEWKNSEWGNWLDYLHSIFSPLIKERDVKAQLAEEGIMHHGST